MKDAQAWGTISRKSVPRFSQHGENCCFVVRGAEFSGAKLGNVVALRFADVPAAKRWHDLPEYQAPIPLRDAGADVTLELYEE